MRLGGMTNSDPETGIYKLITEDARPVEGVWELPITEPVFMNRKDRLLVMTANDIPLV
jgi:hypothetical protein